MPDGRPRAPETWPPGRCLSRRFNAASVRQQPGRPVRTEVVRSPEEGESMSRTRSQVDVVIVGAGQAGLAVSYYLRAFGVDHVVLERGQIAESWRSARWDSFTLVTPNWMTRLPGYTMPAGTGGDFLSRDAVVAMLERFADGLPLHTGTEVLSVACGGDGYEVVTSVGQITARAVVVAGGGQRRP